MIRAFTMEDMPTVLKIWLTASIDAHHFIAAKFWQEQLNDMRLFYIPAAENYLYQHGTQVLGFYSLYENKLAALFVKPEMQGLGIGGNLLEHARQQREQLTLNVYCDNQASVNFYRHKGAVIIGEQICPHTGHKEYKMQLTGLKGLSAHTKKSFSLAIAKGRQSSEDKEHKQ
ncbi:MULTISPECIES: GNAT family N-acetyltransferase [Alteromonadales]|jgi:putative acetyltransferase|uniref:GNAT family N-acetyltransferase n=1 Tax=Shewanella chilikensis TaxID=558541 RepID=A0A6G7LS21_9GAMM|nr:MULTISPECIES: GNAT family N-acetyltransferase [Shewanella]MBZ4678289.1 family N-acetyltransferase [Shewanella sp.]MCA0950128.1 GNAT family N-acetyltransferase [Shewanella chilikensis]MCE9854158.1 GNAT family N-acetyltransferase [Shewanella chilikensis]QIJ04572.1 GNAT family N-acetyltransferase [Shewanella chilikensis]HCD14164.1 GNAT family N-acetyltransferase [Shewanella sp.]